jgi:histone H4
MDAPVVAKESEQQKVAPPVTKKRKRGGASTTKKSGAASTRKPLTNAALRRQAIRAGVKRVSKPVYDEARATLRQYLRTLLAQAVKVAEHSERRVITAEDILYAMSRRHIAIHDFGFE